MSAPARSRGRSPFPRSSVVSGARPPIIDTPAGVPRISVRTAFRRARAGWNGRPRTCDRLVNGEVLCRLSYVPTSGVRAWDRTTDAPAFNRPLYRLSYSDETLVEEAGVEPAEPEGTGLRPVCLAHDGPSGKSRPARLRRARRRDGSPLRAARIRRTNRGRRPYDSDARTISVDARHTPTVRPARLRSERSSCQRATTRTTQPPVGGPNGAVDVRPSPGRLAAPSETGRKDFYIGSRFIGR